MAIELKLTKSDCDTSWGFRITGGAEFDVPITVIKVTENGIADRGGLVVDDVVVRVNDTPTAGLTHNETHDLLMAAGNHLILAVRRDDTACPSPQLPNDQEVNEEVCNILQKEEKKVRFEPILPNSADDLEPEVPNEASPILVKEHGEIVYCESSQKTVETQEKKWSTFLQRPKHSKPIIKKTNDQPQSAPYRVIIKKQKKKSKEDEEKSAQSIKENVEIVEEEKPVEIPEEIVEVEVKATITESEEVIVEEDARSDIDETESQINEAEEMPYVEEKKIGVSQKSLEEKLLEVQKQLAALSQLPSTIQLTLDAVTKELANIVGAKQTMVIEEENEENEEEEEEYQQLLSEAETTTEYDVTDHAVDENCASSNDEERIEEDINETEEACERSDEEPDEFQPEDQQCVEEDQEADPFEGLTEEEKEAKRLEIERLEKYQKELEKFEEFKQRRLQQRPTLPLKPIERPIILPGGRKWLQPDDACPAVRHPKMSDEKIANTIEMFSEPIVGKAKGLTIGTRSGRGPTKTDESTGIVVAKK